MSDRPCSTCLSAPRAGHESDCRECLDAAQERDLRAEQAADALVDWLNCQVGRARLEEAAMRYAAAKEAHLTREDMASVPCPLGDECPGSVYLGEKCPLCLGLGKVRRDDLCQDCERALAAPYCDRCRDCGERRFQARQGVA